MKNESIRKVINVDKPNYAPLFEFKELDNAVIRLSLFKDSVEFDITGQTVKLGAKTSKGLKEQSEGFTINKNNLDIDLKNSILVPGTVEIDLELKDASGTMTTASFFITVKSKVLNDKAVEGTNEFDTFTKTAAKIEEDYKGLRRIIIDENQAANLQDQVNQTNAHLDKKVDEVDLEIERKRIDLFTSLQQGSTTGDAELMDGRVGGNGITYTNIGGNIRDIAKGNGINDKSIAVEKSNFINYKDEKNIFDGSFIHDKSFTVESSTGYYLISGSQVINTRWLSIIKIKNNTILRIKIRGNNRARIGIAYKTDIDGSGLPYRASKMLIVDDNNKGCDLEYKNNDGGLFLIIYSGYELNTQPAIYVYERNIGALLDFNNKINRNSVDFLYNSIDDITYNKIDKLSIAYRVETGIYQIFMSDTNSILSTYVIKLEKGSKYKIIAKGINRCRLALMVNEIDVSELPIGANTDAKMEVDKPLLFDDSKTELEYIFESDKYSYLVAYVGLNQEPTTFQIDKISENVEGVQYLDYNIKIKPSQIIGLNYTTEDDDKLILDKTYDFPTATNEYQAIENDGRRLDLSSDDFLSMYYDKWVGYHIEDGLRVIKKSLGKDESGLYDIYEYDFIPAQYKETILLSSGMHTYELPASFGLAHFMSEYMKYPYKNNGFEYLRKNVRIKIIAIINPWGFNQIPKSYPNSRGVNPNRNFDCLINGESVWSKFPVYSSNKGDSNYNEFNVKGSEPFSEAETRILRDWLLDNNNSKFWIDCHTNTWSNAYTNYLFALSTSKLKDILLNNAKINNERILKKYNKSGNDYIVFDSDTSIKQKWCETIVGVPCFALEFSPANTIWGTSINNESGDITEYASILYIHIIGCLKESY